MNRNFDMHVCLFSNKFIEIHIIFSILHESIEGLIMPGKIMLTFLPYKNTPALRVGI